jgi:hypothetical protein
MNAIHALSQLSYSPMINKFKLKFNIEKEKLSIHFSPFVFPSHFIGEGKGDKMGLSLSISIFGI